MSKEIKILQTAQQYAVAIRPKVEGFPYLAEALRQAGIVRNVWSLPSCQSTYWINNVAVIQLGTPLVSGLVDVPIFSLDKLLKSIRLDKAGKSTFSEFLMSAWEAGVISYEVDFEHRTVMYSGANGEKFTESYPEVSVIK